MVAVTEGRDKYGYGKIDILITLLLIMMVMMMVVMVMVRGDLILKRISLYSFICYYCPHQYINNCCLTIKKYNDKNNDNNE